MVGGTSMRSTLVALSALVLAALALLPAARTGTPSEAPHRSPVELALLPGGRALTANHTADSVSLVDLDAGKVLAETPCGRRPVAVACSTDGRRAAVSNHWSASVTLLEIGEASLKGGGQGALGQLPQGLGFAPAGRPLFA